MWLIKFLQEKKKKKVNSSIYVYTPIRLFNIWLHCCKWKFWQSSKMDWNDNKYFLEEWMFGLFNLYVQLVFFVTTSFFFFFTNLFLFKPIYKPSVTCYVSKHIMVMSHHITCLKQSGLWLKLVYLHWHLCVNWVWTISSVLSIDPGCSLVVQQRPVGLLSAPHAVNPHVQFHSPPLSSFFKQSLQWCLQSFIIDETCVVINSASQQHQTLPRFGFNFQMNYLHLV